MRLEQTLRISKWGGEAHTEHPGSKQEPELVALVGEP